MPAFVAQERLTWRDIIQPSARMVELDGREVAILLVYTLALGVISAAVPLASQTLVNQAAFTGAARPVIALSAIVFGVLLIGSFIRLFQIRVAALISKRLVVRTSLEGAQALLQSPSLAYEFDDREVANRFFDVMSFQVAFTVLASEVLGVVVFSIVGILILALYHPVFFIFIMVVMLVCAFIILISVKRGVRRSKARSKEKYRVAYWLSEIAENRSLLRQTKSSQLIKERSDQISTEYVRTYFAYLRVLLWQSGAVLLVQAIGSSAFFGVGGWLVVNGQLNLGQLVAAEIVVLSSMTALTRIYFYLDSFYEAVIAGMKVSELTQLPRSVPPSRPFQTAVIDELRITSGLLDQPLEVKAGEIIALRGPSRRNCSALLRSMAASDRLDGINLDWESDVFIDRANGPDQILYLARPAVLRMSLAENLALLSDAETMEEARSNVLDNPLLSAEEKANADQPLDQSELSISDRSRYAIARTLMSSRPVVLIDMFFNLLELEDQVTFLREFKARFPERILIVNAFDPAIDKEFSRIVTVRGSSK